MPLECAFYYSNPSISLLKPTMKTFNPNDKIYIQLFLFPSVPISIEYCYLPAKQHILSSTSSLIRFYPRSLFGRKSDRWVTAVKKGTIAKSSASLEIKATPQAIFRSNRHYSEKSRILACKSLSSLVANHRHRMEISIGTYSQDEFILEIFSNDGFSRTTRTLSILTIPTVPQPFH